VNHQNHRGSVWEELVFHVTPSEDTVPRPFFVVSGLSFFGSLTMNRVPLPFSVSKEIVPWCSQTIFFVIINPNPVPLDALVLKKF
jgi:hypothetical protein